MGKNSKTPKKPENLGKGQVTAIQVAFIVDRYLIDNNYTQTLSTFRSEASSLLSKAKLKQAPKSLLSLEDILNEYIRLKEQRVAVDQQRCRVEKLLQGMQEVINAYRSPDVISASSPLDPISPTSENSPLKANSGFMNSTSTPINMRSSMKVQSPVSTAPVYNKRKASGPISELSSSTRKSFAQAPKDLSNGSEVISLIGYNGAMHIFNTHDLPIPSSMLSQSSGFKRESSSPQTPSQQFSPENCSSVSQLHMSSMMETTDPSLYVTPANGPKYSPHASENGSSCSDYHVQRHHMSPSKVGAKTSIRKEHVKGRLDFGDFEMIKTTAKCVPDGSICGTDGEARKNFDMDDILNFSILDADVSLSYLINLDRDSQISELSGHMELDQALNPFSSTTDGVGELPVDFSGSFSYMLSSEDNVLSQKDINREGDGDKQRSRMTATCLNADDPGKRERKHALGQENMPQL